VFVRLFIYLNIHIYLRHAYRFTENTLCYCYKKTNF